jgi:hypothetical protein
VLPQIRERMSWPRPTSITGTRECLQWASEAETEKQQKTFLAMARTWMQAALQVAGTLARVDDQPSSS